MTKPPSPFAGVKLSDLGSRPSPVPLDQQLFRLSPPPAAPPSTPTRQEARKRRQDVKTQRRPDVKTSMSQDGKTPMRHDGKTSLSQDANASRRQDVKSYDINDDTFERETVRISKAEQRDVERLKLSLRELLDGTIGKNDIFRAGLHFLLEDFHEKGERSEVVSRLRKKTK